MLVNFKFTACYGQARLSYCDNLENARFTCSNQRQKNYPIPI